MSSWVFTILVFYDCHFDTTLRGLKYVVLVETFHCFFWEVEELWISDHSLA